MESSKAFGALRGVIVARYGSIRAFARALGKQNTTVNRMVAAGYRWRVDEALAWCELLGIPQEQLPLFFLN